MNYSAETDYSCPNLKPPNILPKPNILSNAFLGATIQFWQTIQFIIGQNILAETCFGQSLILWQGGSQQVFVIPSITPKSRKSASPESRFPNSFYNLGIAHSHNHGDHEVQAQHLSYFTAFVGEKLKKL